MTDCSWLDDVRRLLDHVASSDATEVEYATESFRLRLKRRVRLAPQGGQVESQRSIRKVDGIQVVAPLTGVFYCSASQGAPALISEGDQVQPDTVVGLIETMKIFNEVTAECRGRVRQILADSGQLVHAGDCLMLVEPTTDGDAERARSWS